MILVTGATGHIGNVLVRELLGLGKKVRALILPGEATGPLSGMPVELFEGDVLNPDSLSRAFLGVDIAYHLAGVISILPGKNETLQRVNVLGTYNVLLAALEARVRRLIYTSSIHAIRRVPEGVLIDESLPFDPHHALSEYDRSKAEASLGVKAAIRAGLNAVIVCPTGVIGPYDYRGSEVGNLILDSMKRQPQFCVEGAYDFVDVRDVARGLILACEKGRTGEVYILSGEQISVARLMDTVQEFTGIHVPRLKIPLPLARFAALFMPLYYRLTRTKPRFTSYALETVAGNSVISHAKAQHELGYMPRSLRESIADTVQWLRENSLPLRTS